MNCVHPEYKFWSLQNFLLYPKDITIHVMLQILSGGTEKEKYLCLCQD
jgi:hypothetical protein